VIRERGTCLRGRDWKKKIVEITKKTERGQYTKTLEKDIFEYWD